MKPIVIWFAAAIVWGYLGGAVAQKPPERPTIECASEEAVRAIAEAYMSSKEEGDLLASMLILLNMCRIPIEPERTRI